MKGTLLAFLPVGMSCNPGRRAGGRADDASPLAAATYCVFFFFFFNLNPVFLQVWLGTGASVGAVCYWFMPGTHIQKSRVRVWKFSQHFDVAITSKLQAHNHFPIDSFLSCYTKVLHHSRLEITHSPPSSPQKNKTGSLP